MTRKILCGGALVAALAFSVGCGGSSGGGPPTKEQQEKLDKEKEKMMKGGAAPGTAPMGEKK